MVASDFPKIAEGAKDEQERGKGRRQRPLARDLTLASVVKDAHFLGPPAPRPSAVPSV